LQCGEQKPQNPPVKYVETALAMFVLSASLGLADDFKAINGKQYNDVTVSRVEADGIVLKGKSGISKIYFTELPKDVQERFHYRSAQEAHFTADGETRTAQQNAAPGGALLAEPLTNSLLGMVRQTIHRVSTRISPCCRTRFIIPTRTKAGESAPRFSHQMVVPFEWSTRKSLRRVSMQ